LRKSVTKASEFWDYAGLRPTFTRSIRRRTCGKLLDARRASVLRHCNVKLEAAVRRKPEAHHRHSHVLRNEYINLSWAPEKMKVEGRDHRAGRAADRFRPSAVRRNWSWLPIVTALTFAKVNGQFPLGPPLPPDQAEVNMQLDVGNCLSGGG